jgi:hypothetical protein
MSSTALPISGKTPNSGTKCLKINKLYIFREFVEIINKIPSKAVMSKYSKFTQLIYF